MPDTLTERHDNGVTFLDIDNDNCSATVSLFGGHVTHWQPHGHQPVLWMSRASALDGSAAIRGGIPVCWPWFGPAENKGRHGLVRNAHWELLDSKTESDTTVLQLACKIDPEFASQWQHPERIEQTLILGRQLHQNCRVKNTGDRPLHFAYALHNYFAVSAPENIDIPVLADTPYYCKVTDTDNLRDAGPVQFTSPVDRVYQCSDNASLQDFRLRRNINIDKWGSANWVLWNPGATAADMADVHAGGEREFVCLETANTQDLQIAPGETTEFGQCISLTSMDPVSIGQ